MVHTHADEPTRQTQVSFKPNYGLAHTNDVENQWKEKSVYRIMMYASV